MRSSLTAFLLSSVALAALAGCSADAEPPASAPASAAPAPSPSASAPGDAPGAIACRQLAEAVEAGSLMTPGVVDGLAQVASTADAPIADSAQRLVVAYRKAVGSAGTDDEPDAVADVSAAGADLAQVCADSGLETVG